MAAELLRTRRTQRKSRQGGALEGEGFLYTETPSGEEKRRLLRRESQHQQE